MHWAEDSTAGGVAHAFLCSGTDLTAGFDFGAAGTPRPGLMRTVRKVSAGGTEDAEPVTFAERNSAFATHAFLALASTLESAERAVLECHAPDGRHAAVTVTRRHVSGTDGRSS